MIQFAKYLSAFLLLESVVSAAGASSGVMAARPSLPIVFEKNQGQVDPQVLYLARNRESILYLTAAEAVLVFSNLSREDDLPGRLGVLRAPGARVRAGNGAKKGAEVLRMKWVGAREPDQVAGLEALPGKSNYFYGKDPAKWVTDVAQYGRVLMKGLYPGIDLAYYEGNGNLEFDWIVGPGAEPGKIRLQLQGMRACSVEPNGDIKVEMPGGRNLYLKAPIAYQESNGVKTPVGANYRLSGQNLVSLQLADYDSSRRLIIDPVLVYSSFYGGSGADTGNAIAVDSAGYAYVIGTTYSANFPVINAFQATDVDPNSDAFVGKLNPGGSAFIYSTYFGSAPGGSIGSTEGYGIAVDTSGNAYVTGYTSATDFPLVNAFQTSGGGVFVSKFNSSGSALVYSTYLGGSNTEYAYSIAVDVTGNAYVTGNTSSTDFPLLNAIQASLGGSADVFVTKFNSAGNALMYSTYLGGSGNDQAYSIATDGVGNAYVCGRTTSSNFPVLNALLPGHSGGSTFGLDAFVAKLNAGGSALVYSSYLGGTADDYGQGIAADAGGNAYVTGWTYSTNFPVLNAFQAFNNASGSANAFISKINPSGSAFAYSTYFGGNYVAAYGIAVDSGGNAYFTGDTASLDLPLANPIQATPGGGGDVFVAKMNASGSALHYSTFLGGGLSDRGQAIAIDPSGNAYVLGETHSSGFPTAAPFQGSCSNCNGLGGHDAFVLKVSAFVPSATPTSTPSPSRTASPTSSSTLTRTQTPTRTITETFSPSPSSTPTRSPTATATMTLTQSQTSTKTITGTNSPSPTHSMTMTPSSSITASATLTLTRTPSPTRTATATMTSTPVVSATATSSPSATLTVSPSFTASPTLTASGTVTPTFYGTPAAAAAAFSPGAIFSYPNPAVPGGAVTFVFAPTARAVLRIYDWSGRKVLELPESAVNPGAGIARWDGRDLGGKDFASGSYFVVLRGEAGTIRGKFTVLRP